MSEHLEVTPLLGAPALGEGVAVKIETFQPTGSFKVRGALAAVAAALAVEPARPLVAASAGNHALGVAFAASVQGAHATVVVPENASPAKIEALERLPVEVIRHGDGYSRAEAHALSLAEAGAYYVSPYNDRHVIAGQGTMGLELADQMPDLDTVIAPVGGGGLVSGLGLATGNRGIRLVGVQAAASPAMRAAWDKGRITPIRVGETLADGLAGNLEDGSVTVDLARRHVSKILTVTEVEIASAIRFLATELGLVAEGAGAVATAALLSRRIVPEGPTAVLLTGRNIAAGALARVLSRRGTHPHALFPELQ